MPCSTLSFLCFVTFVLALILTPLFRRVAVRLGLVDCPDFQRKIHLKPIPRIGGVPVFAAYVGSYIALTFMPGGLAHFGSASFSTAWSLVPAALLVFLIGLADDIFGLQPWQKLAGELAASGLAVSYGVRIVGFDGIVFNNWISVLGTVVWLVGCANALNLIDGIDGLASGIALLATATAGIAALLNGDTGLALAALPMACALLGFLRYNKNPASIFLGDCGSLTVGFLLGCYAVLWSEKTVTVLGMTAPLMSLAVPLLDTAIAIVRRFLRRQPIFTADRSHIHHRLLALGFSHRGVVVLLYGAAGCASVLSLLMSRYHDRLGGIILVLFAAAAILGIERLGYAEFSVARHILFTGAFRRLVNNQLSLDACEERIANAATLDECWSAIESASRSFGFHRVQLQFAGRTFAYQDCVRPSNFWQIQVPISNSEFLTMSRSFDGCSESDVVEPFVDALRRTLDAKRLVFSSKPLATPHLPAVAISKARVSVSREEQVPSTP
jgi:UDP-GlcNAc:undecaprenyl-phosphate GlcNAc-1-phosphate transferase